MSYPDQLDYINFLFERLQDFETETESHQTNPPGRPKAYSDASLIVFFYHDAQRPPSISCTTPVVNGSPGMAYSTEVDPTTVPRDIVEALQNLVVQNHPIYYLC